MTRHPPTPSEAKILRMARDHLRYPSKSEKRKTGRSPGGSYLVPKGAKVTKRTPVVTTSKWRDFQLGVSHGNAAKLRKAKRLGYGLRGESEVAPQSVRTREGLTNPVYSQPWEHTYINTRGDVAYDFYWKHGLRHMQDYQHALDEELRPKVGDGMKG